MRVEPFTINISDEAIQDLHERIDRTRWPSRIEDIGWEQGTDIDYLQDLVQYWRNEFDWRKQEAKLNELPQFMATIGDQDIHFVHQRAKNGNGLPVMLVNGWPSSFVELVPLVPLLTDPEAHGGKPEDAFDVIIPSIPGYGFSPPPTRKGMSLIEVSKIFGNLMDGLGYETYGVQGGNFGATFATHLSRFNPDKVIGIHLNFVTLHVPTPQRVLDGNPTKEDQEYIDALNEYRSKEGAYGLINRTKPQSLGFGLNDSPAGLAAWIVEKFRAWGGCGRDVDKAFSRDDLLTNISVYWFTETITSACRLYWESGPLKFEPGEMVPAPCGVARFPEDPIYPTRSWTEMYYHVKRWTNMPEGGHFSGLEQPEALVGEIREFFGTVR